VFADAPAGTQVVDTVVDAMTGYLRTSNANLGGAFVTSRETDRLVEDARRAGADLLGCNPREVVFGPNTTSLAFALSRSIGRTLNPGDEVVTTVLDHDANIAPWVLAARDAGAMVRRVDVRDRDGTLDLESLGGALSKRTRVVAFTLASNALGTVTPADRIVTLVRRLAPRAVVVGDAVHLAPHRAINVRELDVDVLFCSAYKFFGPHLGLMYGRGDLLETWQPYKVRPAPDRGPDRWETGTGNHEGLAGLVAAVDYLAGVGERFGTPSGDGRRSRVQAGMEAIRSYEATLSTGFLGALGGLPQVRLYGIEDPSRVDERTPTFAIRVGDDHPRATAEALAERGVFVWDGNYYALAIMERLGLEATGGAVRVGFCHYHSLDEVDRVLSELGALS
jgi:cysteine desulfurase family protein (TIGR01976 family)